MGIKELGEAKLKLKYESLSSADSLVILRADIERELRNLAVLSRIEYVKPHPTRRLVTELKARGVLKPELAYSILLVYNACSKVVHGESLPDKDVLLIRELGIKALFSLDKLSQKHGRCLNQAVR